MIGDILQIEINLDTESSHHRSSSAIVTSVRIIHGSDDDDEDTSSCAEQSPTLVDLLNDVDLNRFAVELDRMFRLCPQTLDQ